MVIVITVNTYFSGILIIHDLTATPRDPDKRPLKLSIRAMRVFDELSFVSRNSRFPRTFDYKISNLEEMDSKFLSQGKLYMKFKHPKHMVMVHTNEVRKLNKFYSEVYDIFKEMKMLIVPKQQTVNTFDTSEFFKLMTAINTDSLNINHLSKIVLENCDIPKLPVQMGNFPITYLSLSGSKLGASKYDRDTLWDWMTQVKIAQNLTILKMDSIGLQIIPFEIKDLQNLQELYVAKNKLRYIPTSLFYLRKLTTLSIADNSVYYLPENLNSRKFKLLDISNNPFKVNSLRFDHVRIYQAHSLKQFGEGTGPLAVKPLVHLSLSVLMSSFIRFKRQDVPRSLWHLFDVGARCIKCNNYILPDYCNVCHIADFPVADNLIKNTVGLINWQSIICIICTKKSDILDY